MWKLMSPTDDCHVLVLGSKVLPCESYVVVSLANTFKIFIVWLGSYTLDRRILNGKVYSTVFTWLAWKFTEMLSSVMRSYQMRSYQRCGATWSMLTTLCPVHTDTVPHNHSYCQILSSNISVRGEMKKVLQDVLQALFSQFLGTWKPPKPF